MPTEITQNDIIVNLLIFLMSSFLGLELIRHVSKLLHTPLMSLTNVISSVSASPPKPNGNMLLEAARQAKVTNMLAATILIPWRGTPIILVEQRTQWARKKPMSLGFTI